MPGDKSEPKGFILTAILGIVGAFVATYLGQSVGWYEPGESAGFLGGVVGAVVVLFVYGLLAGRQLPDGTQKSPAARCDQRGLPL